MIAFVVLAGKSGALLICQWLSLVALFLFGLDWVAFPFAFLSRPEEGLVSVPGYILSCGG